jgi:hypothetical protein
MGWPVSHVPIHWNYKATMRARVVDSSELKIGRMTSHRHPVSPATLPKREIPRDDDRAWWRRLLNVGYRPPSSRENREHSAAVGTFHPDGFHAYGPIVELTAETFTIRDSLFGEYEFPRGEAVDPCFTPWGDEW